VLGLRTPTNPPMMAKEKRVNSEIRHHLWIASHLSGPIMMYENKLMSKRYMSKPSMPAGSYCGLLAKVSE
jgi:hypothetical protein